MFELHERMPGMRSAEYQATIPLKFFIIMRMFRQSTALTAGRFRRCWEEKTTRSNRMSFRLVYSSGREKVSSGNLGSGTLADKTPAHWPRLTENWWSDPQSELLDWQNPETGPKLSAYPRSTLFFESANPLDLSPKSTIRELFKAKSADPRTYSPPSFQDVVFR